MREEQLQTTATASTYTEAYWQGMKLAAPVMLGYLPIAISFGVLAVQTGMSFFHSVLMSMLVYAGASQFMAVNMLAIGAVGIEIVLATFVLNLRHFVMSLSLFSSLQHIPKRWQAVLAHGITDESFALASLKRKTLGEHPSAAIFAGMFSGALGMWLIGTIAGALIGNVVPPALSASMGIALYALFIGLLVPAIRAHWKVGIVALASAGLCWLFSLYLSEGWAIVLATVIGSFTGVWVLEEDDK
ncbi:AzlC family ABC transporter permease [Natribacillus halophilus]|uniref:4-azaleucine resistance probable transporter AzlC n=1 Tax=Natribacillus halophilus TaxID=549003 RepID=A0A1G8J5A7_9BACI|nr:AzlC family ABC transporter permease [Natribacillus halophilus]SDI25820.1 4-azaleucine resistance probable transporter AzlC [Natribacillus halophilus]